MTTHVYRNAATGEFVNEAYALEHPDTTVRETLDGPDIAALDTSSGQTITLRGVEPGFCDSCRKVAGATLPFTVHPADHDHSGYDVALRVCGTCLAGALAVRFAAHELADSGEMPTIPEQETDQ